MYIYILKLKDNKYYIGKTNNPSKRLQDHQLHNGSSWTKKYDPIDLLELIETNDPFDEDKFTLKYMAKYGIENVRGGSFTQIILDNPTINHIKKMITAAEDRCFKCNKPGHFAKNCELFTLRAEVKRLQGLLAKKETKEMSTQTEQLEDISSTILKETVNIASSLYNTGTTFLSDLVAPVKESIKRITPDDKLKESFNDNEEIINYVVNIDRNKTVITNYGNIRYLAWNYKQYFPVKTVYCNSNKILDDEQIVMIMEYQFRSYHYSKLKKELEDLLNISYPCQNCGRLFTSKQGAAYHEMKYCKKNKFSCSFCGKSFDTKNGVRFHIQKWCSKKVKSKQSYY